MSKLLLTNSEKWNSALRESLAEASFRANGIVDDKDFFLTTYFKFNFDNQNFYHEGDDFIAVSGTLVYKGETGNTALKSLLNDLRQKSIKQVRRDLYGFFLVAYKLDGVLHCFTDENGNYAAYYYYDGKNFLITNTYYHIEKVVKQEPLKVSLLEEFFSFISVSGSTHFENIFRLLGHQEIVFDCSSVVLTISEIEKNHYALSGSSIDDYVEEICEVAQDVMRETSCVVDDPHIFMTGGVDSRLLLDNYLKAGYRPTLFSWYGAPENVNSHEEDCVIVKEIARRANLDVEDLDLSSGDGFYPALQIPLEKKGEYAFAYGGNPAWHSVLSDYDVKFIDFGCSGEFIRGWYEATAEDENKSFEGFVAFQLGMTGVQDIEKKTPYGTDLIEKKIEDFKNLARLEGLDINNLNEEDCGKLYFYDKMYNDCSFQYQHANYYCYAFPFFAQKKISDLILGVPYEHKKKNKLNLMMQKELNESLLGVQFFSHCKFYDFDESKMMLVDNAKNKLKANVRNGLTKIPGGQSLLNLRSDIKTKKTEESRRGTYDAIFGIMDSSATFASLKLNMTKQEYISAYLPILIRLSQQCQMIDELRNH